jgi:hypothetical protein
MRLRLRFGLVSINKLPAPNAGGLYKTNFHQRGRFCRGLSVPKYTGRRGHFFSQGGTTERAGVLHCIQTRVRVTCRSNRKSK